MSPAGGTPDSRQQLVLQLRWTEGGQERRELFGPWTQGDPETEDGEVAHLTAAHRFLGEWHRVTGLGVADGGATVILVNDPDAWLQDREEQAEAASAHIRKGMVSAAEIRQQYGLRGADGPPAAPL